VELVAQLWDFVVHLDAHLAAFVAQHGAWVYGLLFLIVFCETGLVVTPFLPGDSLLFVVGTLAAAGGMDIYAVSGTLVGGPVRRQRQLLDWTLGRPQGFSLPGITLVQPAPPAASARVL